YVVNLDAPSPAGLGRSLVVDPEGTVRVEAGAGEELVTDVLDLDAVTRARRHGLAGVSRMWDQLIRTGPEIELPVYGGRFRPPPPERGSPKFQTRQVVAGGRGLDQPVEGASLRDAGRDGQTA